MHINRLKAWPRLEQYVPDSMTEGDINGTSTVLSPGVPDLVHKI